MTKELYQIVLSDLYLKNIDSKNSNKVGKLDINKKESWNNL